MKNLNTVIFFASISLIIFSTLLLIIGLVKYNLFFTIILVPCIFVGFLGLKHTYLLFLTQNRKLIFRNQQLTAEELEIVEDAKKLVKSVDKSIVISNFNVYKVKFLWRGWFDYDEETGELSIFIPFKNFLKFGKNFCFLAVVHEVLHSQNLKKNLMIFDIKFLEGLNQLLTIWLIKNYSKKYEIPTEIHLVLLKINKEKSLDLFFGYKMYDKEVEMVTDVLENSNVDLKEVFLKYIELEPEYFKSFVPWKYLKIFYFFRKL